MTANELPHTAEGVRELVDNLTFEPAPTPEQEAALLESLPPQGSEIMVVRSLRLPMELDEAVTAAAKATDVPKSAWIRQAIEMALAMQAEQDEPISRADALRALTLLRPVRRAA
ncbi:MAG TPA: ribbon-helix-helix protein, CopG family [Micromonosporaceae bacterium]